MSEEVVEKPLSTLEKVSRMHALTSIAMDEDLKKLIAKHKSGDIAHEIFVKAIEAEVEKLMTSKAVEEVPQTLSDMPQMLHDAKTVLTALKSTVSSLYASPLIEVLFNVNETLGGAALEAPVITQAPKRRQPVTQQAQQRPQVRQPVADNYDDDAPRRAPMSLFE